MTDRIEEIVNRAVSHTLTILAASPDRWAVARIGLQTIHDDLAISAPGHPALKRLQAFIAERDRAEIKR